MNTIKIMFDYGCLPLWIYDENGHYIGNAEFTENSPLSDIANYKDIEAAFSKVQEEYENLFINNVVEFSCIGFQSEEQKAKFTENFYNAVDLLEQSANGKYNIVNTVDLDNI